MISKGYACRHLRDSLQLDIEMKFAVSRNWSLLAISITKKDLINYELRTLNIELTQAWPERQSFSFRLLSCLRDPLIEQNLVFKMFNNLMSTYDIPSLDNLSLAQSERERLVAAIELFVICKAADVIDVHLTEGSE